MSGIRIDGLWTQEAGDTLVYLAQEIRRLEKERERVEFLESLRVAKLPKLTDVDRSRIAERRQRRRDTGWFK